MLKLFYLPVLVVLMGNGKAFANPRYQKIEMKSFSISLATQQTVNDFLLVRADPVSRMFIYQGGNVAVGATFEVIVPRHHEYKFKMLVGVKGLPAIENHRVKMKRYYATQPSKKEFTKNKLQPKLAIIGGSDAVITDYPYQVQLLQDDEVVCGGAILSSTVIATAGHCCNETGADMIIKVGSSTPNEGTDVGAFVKLVNSNYTRIPLRNDTDDFDICKITLETALDLTTDSVKSIPLCVRKPTTGTDCTATGYGATAWEGDNAASLQKVTLPMLNWDTCKTLIEANNNTFTLTSRMICAGDLTGLRDACTNDSGGPLMCNVNGTDCLAGINSWGIQCGLANVAPVFVNLRQRNIRNFLNLDTSENDYGYEDD